MEISLTPQAWFEAGPMSWPLFCPQDTNCALDCLASGGFWFYVLLHGALFYGVAFGIAMLKRHGKMPDHTGFDEKFNNTFYIAHHCPMIFMSIPMSILALAGSWDALQSGDPKIQYGLISSPYLNEAGVWFFSFISLDTVLMLIHGMATPEQIVHHAIFMSLTMLLAMRCSCGMVGGFLIAQELSTPFLNIFLLLRAWFGLTPYVVSFFAMFAMQFFCVRIVLNIFNTGHCLYTYFTTPEAMLLSRLEGYILLAALLCGVALQLTWWKTIWSRLIGAVFGDSKKGADKEN